MSDALTQWLDLEVYPRLSHEVVFQDLGDFRRAGAEGYVALCPAHNDHRPSFNMRKGHPTGHCFACGHTRSWWQHVELRVGAGRAVIVELARLAGVEPLAGGHISREAEAAAQARREAEAGREAFAAACASALTRPEGAAVLAYLRGRGYGADECQAAGLGAWPPLEVALRHDVRGLGLDVAGMGTSHLLLIALRDGAGHLAGFALRSPGEPPAGVPKYLYSRGLAKGGLLPGLHQARTADAAVVLVEGLIDSAILGVCGLHVASLGGAILSVGQVEALRRARVGSVILSLDEDAAGRDGTERAAQDLLAAGIRCYVAPSLPPGVKDPDELVRAQGLDAYRDCLRQAEGAAKWLTRRMLAAHDVTTDLGRDAALAAVLTAAERMGPLDRDDATGVLAETLRLAPAAILEALARADERAKAERARRLAADLAADLAQVARGEGGQTLAAVVAAAQRQVEHLSGGSTLTSVCAADLAAQAPPPQDWVLQDALPAREIGLLVGGDGTGKSLLALGLAISVACGIPWAGGLLPAPAQTGRVVYFSGEDDTDEAHRRIRAIMGRLRRDAPPNDHAQVQRLESGLRQIEIIPLDGHPMPLLAAGRQDADPQETAWVGRLRERIEGARLLILDPLVMFHSVSENDNQHMDRLMRCVQRLVRSTPGCAALLVHHAGQGSVRDGADDAMVARGATALHGAARAVFALRRLTPTEEDRFREAGEDPWRLRAIRGPKISRAQERPVAYVRFDAAGVPMLHEVAALAASQKSQQRKAKPYAGR